MSFLNLSDKILVTSLRITDHINQQVDTASFTMTERPNVGKEVIISQDGNIIFGGVVVRVKTVTQGIRSLFEVECRDYTHYLDRRLVNQRYTNQSVEAIIADLIDNNADEFTYTNVDCDTLIDTITFNRIPVSNCIQQLAELVGFSWYVDYQKDIHFFAENSEVAPFSLSATGDKHIWESLTITEDISQIRNQVIVIGGQEPIATRTERYVADGQQRQFPLAYQYASEPDLTVDSVPVELGLDFVDDETSHDAFWSYNPSYIRFRSDTFPAANDIVEVTGIPIKRVIVSVPNVTSIRENGVYEFKIEDPQITSRAAAIERAQVELQGYANGIEEGSFKTYEPGLHSGQTISIDVPQVTGDFIIQSVSMSMRTESDPIYSISIASTKTLGIIRFLQRLLVSKEVIQEGDTIEELLNFTDGMEMTDSVTIPARSTTGPYYWTDATETTGAGEKGVYNFTTWT